MDKAKKLILKIEWLDAKGENNEFKENIFRIVSTAVRENKPLNFVCFTCSTINPPHMFGNQPWNYVRSDPKGNNLSQDISQLENIMRELRACYSNVQLKIIIGNTDPYYIYLEQFKDYPGREQLMWIKFIEQWEKYQKGFSAWLENTAPSLKVEVISWFHFERSLEKRMGRIFEKEFNEFRKNLGDYFNEDQLAWELRKLKTQFKAGAYFDGLRKPDDKVLKSWVSRKFSEYAIQALWIYENIDNAILIQNEKPSDLRSQMYQPAIRNKYNDSLPIVYFLGVDNVGYQ